MIIYLMIFILRIFFWCLLKHLHRLIFNPYFFKFVCIHKQYNVVLSLRTYCNNITHFSTFKKCLEHTKKANEDNQLPCDN